MFTKRLAHLAARYFVRFRLNVKLLGVAGCPAILCPPRVAGVNEIYIQDTYEITHASVATTAELTIPLW